MMPLDARQFEQGLSLLRGFLRGINIRVEDNRVYLTYTMEFPDGALAKSFAETLKKTYEEGL